MQKQLLEQNPSAGLRVYTVWLPMLWTDAREKWNGKTMPDFRVTHFWDGETLVGEWFAQQVDGFEGVSWDVYYLYGPEATWETTPQPLLGSGRTIYTERQALNLQVRTLLGK